MTPIAKFSVNIGDTFKKALLQLYPTIALILKKFNKFSNQFQITSIFDFGIFEKEYKKIISEQNKIFEKRIDYTPFAEKSNLSPSIREGLYLILTENKQHPKLFETVNFHKNDSIILIELIIQNIDSTINVKHYKTFSDYPEKIKQDIRNFLVRDQEFYEKGFHSIYHASNSKMGIVRYILSTIINSLNLEQNNNRRYLLNSVYKNITDIPLITNAEKDNDNKAYRVNVNAGVHTLFGNFKKSNSLNHESALHYYLTNANVNGNFNYAIFLKEQLEYLGLQSETVNKIVKIYGKELIRLNQYPGNLYQIFYTAEDLEKFSLITTPYGRNSKIMGIDSFLKKINIQESLDHNPYKKINLDFYEKTNLNDAEIQSRFITNIDSIIFDNSEHFEILNKLDEFIEQILPYLICNTASTIQKLPKYKLSTLIKNFWFTNLLEIELENISKSQLIDKELSINQKNFIENSNKELSYIKEIFEYKKDSKLSKYLSYDSYKKTF